MVLPQELLLIETETGNLILSGSALFREVRIEILEKPQIFFTGI